MAFDPIADETRRNHPNSILQAHLDVEATLSGFGYDRVQGSLFVTENEDMANLFQAILAHKARPWFPASMRDILTFRAEQRSDLA